jgi:LPS sulfotransferase NodH
MEYLNFRVIGNLFKRLGYEIDKFGYPPHEELDNYWSTIQQLRTSPNGVFGYKMFTSNYIEIARRATHLLKRLTPNYIIYLLRRDILGQAISYSRAQRSNNWFKGLSEINEKYDFNHIRSCILSIKNQRKCWEDIFNLTEVQPIRVFYEDILISESSVISLIADSIGAHFNKKNILPIPTIDKQRDSISKIWRQKFIDECRNDPELYNYVSQYNW